MKNIDTKLKIIFKRYNLETANMKRQTVQHVIDFTCNFNDVMDFYFRLIFM